MSEPQHSQSALIVDEDLGFVLWLGQQLAEAGYPAVPAFDCRQAASHIRQFQVSVDLAIVNPSLPGVARMLRALGRANRNLRIIFVEDPGAGVRKSLPAAAILKKPGVGEPVSGLDWFQKLRRAFSEATPFAVVAPARG